MATTTPPTTPRQQSIPGTEPDNQHVAAAIELALDAKDEQKRAAERKKAADDAVLILMVASGLTHYPYTDRDTGKRKWWIVDTTPRGRSVNQRSELPADQEADEPELSESERVERAGERDDARAERDANEVTHRRVPRATAEAEIAAIADETRARDVSGTALEQQQADAAADGALRPARSYEDNDEDDADEPVLPREPERFELLELHDKPRPAVNPVIEVAADEPEDTEGAPEAGAGDKRFDAALLAAGKCGLRSKTGAGHHGAGCEVQLLDGKHAGLHVSGAHRWKAKRPKVGQTAHESSGNEQVATP